MFAAYWVPIMVFNVWIVVVTFAQHHADDTHVFKDGEWTHTRGALQTTDRSYGYLGDIISKHVTDGHIVHHFYATQIPHYNLMDATKAAYELFEKKGVHYSSPKTNPWWDYYSLVFRHAAFTTPTATEDIMVLTNTKLHETLKAESKKAK
jgi:fatty acid desaturase